MGTSFDGTYHDDFADYMMGGGGMGIVGDHSSAGSSEFTFAATTSFVAAVDEAQESESQDGGVDPQGDSGTSSRTKRALVATVPSNQHRNHTNKEEEHGVGGQQLDIDNEDDEFHKVDEQTAEFRQHTTGELDRVCESIQTSLGGLANALVTFYQTSVEVQHMLDHIQSQETAEFARLDALEPKVIQMKALLSHAVTTGTVGNAVQNNDIINVNAAQATAVHRSKT